MDLEFNLWCSYSESMLQLRLVFKCSVMCWGPCYTLPPFGLWWILHIWSCLKSWKESHLFSAGTDPFLTILTKHESPVFPSGTLSGEMASVPSGFIRWTPMVWSSSLSKSGGSHLPISIAKVFQNYCSSASLKALPRSPDPLFAQIVI